ncbi:transglycosylase SLT domain-containing protein [Anaeromyxobacter oryzisoli]|uniref:transglycosylase SLT domain-containing protein n=1 Tax=Anaeromyxobacter oryzisoli TaxID=2925408 RepID=UPI001F58D189|nr:transglycosylase SLT domain-containing protein [Anaeromyxobacter sp. SG63]
MREIEPRRPGALFVVAAVALATSPTVYATQAARSVPVSRTAAAHRAPAATSARQVHAHLASRMPRLDGGARARLGEAILVEAALARLDPLLVLALIEVESSFDPAARSAAGAVGLMQLQAPTMRAEARRSGLPSSDPRDPVANVQAGVRYLRRLVVAFGSLDVALVAYNVGPNRMIFLLRQGGIPDELQYYPRRVRVELERIRREATAIATAAPAARVATD